MKYKEVESSNIAAMAHDGAIMGVKFKNGTEYYYYGVPKSLFDEVIGAASVGRAFNQLIKSRPDLYPYNGVA